MFNIIKCHIPIKYRATIKKLCNNACHNGSYITYILYRFFALQKLMLITNDKK